VRRPTGAAWLVSLSLCAPVWAGGGHFAVDDAIILGPGECDIESWATHADGGNALAHAGLQCGAFGAEWGLAAESVHEDGSQRTLYGAQLKWAREWQPGWHAGFSVTPARQTRERPGYVGSNVSALLTWMPGEHLAVHVNAGRDLLQAQPDQGRHGAAIEWTLQRQWTLVLERYLLDATQFARAGARWVASERWSVDLSRAYKLHGERASNWTLGVTVSLR